MTSKATRVTGSVLSLLVVGMFTFSAVMKFFGGEDLEKGMAHLGLPMDLVTTIGAIEIACVAVYAFPPTAVVGAILLTGYLGGAILTHLRVGDPWQVQLGLGVAVWAGLWLRDGRLRTVMPVRRPAAE